MTPPAGPPGLPHDASEVEEHLAGCTHFAGETGDNEPEREEEIHAGMAEIGCDRIYRDLARIRAKHAGNGLVLEALETAAQL